MQIKISAKTKAKIRGKHGLDWPEIASVYESNQDLLEYRKGETGIAFGRTRSGIIITVITISKGGVRWVKTARRATTAEQKKFRNRMQR